MLLATLGMMAPASVAHFVGHNVPDRPLMVPALLAVLFLLPALYDRIRYGSFPRITLWAGILLILWGNLRTVSLIEPCGTDDRLTSSVRRREISPHLFVFIRVNSWPASSRRSSTTPFYFYSLKTTDFRHNDRKSPKSACYRKIRRRGLRPKNNHERPGISQTRRCHPPKIPTSIQASPVPQHHKKDRTNPRSPLDISLRISYFSRK